MTIFTEHNDVNPVVAEVVRSGFTESRHRGAVAGLAADGTQVISAGNTAVPFFPRSANKPLQATAMLRSGLDLDGELLALAAASHSGEDFHVDGVRKILSGAGLTEDDLRCPPSWPLDLETARRLIARGEGMSRIRMNCSGKHAAMLATCVLNDWPTRGYLAPEHPLQQAIRRTVEELAGEQVPATGVDGCGAPLFALTLAGLARAFRALVLAAPGTPGAPGGRRHARAPGMDQRHQPRRAQADGRGAWPAGQGRAPRASTRSRWPTARGRPARSRSTTGRTGPGRRSRWRRCACSAPPSPTNSPPSPSSAARPRWASSAPSASERPLAVRRPSVVPTCALWLIELTCSYDN